MRLTDELRSETKTYLRTDLPDIKYDSKRAGRIVQDTSTPMELAEELGQGKRVAILRLESSDTGLNERTNLCPALEQQDPRGIVYAPRVTVFKSYKEGAPVLPVDRWYSVDVVVCTLPSVKRVRQSLHLMALHGVDIVIVNGIRADDITLLEYGRYFDEIHVVGKIKGA